MLQITEALFSKCLPISGSKLAEDEVVDSVLRHVVVVFVTLDERQAGAVLPHRQRVTDHLFVAVAACNNRDVTIII